jgi:hypothetical protein
LENFQIVNGSQTIHALFEAFTEKPEGFERISILCRIYETRNPELSVNIAEYTNSQNPVTSRDIRSNDYLQRKLETELKALGYNYERKKGQHSASPKETRIDAEKAGQSLLAFFNKMPAEAKTSKRVIFAEKYEEIFGNNITADSVLLATSLFNEIERRKLQRRAQLAADITNYEIESFILHASYYILYILSEFAEKHGVRKEFRNFNKILDFYDEGLSVLRTTVTKEMTDLQELYSHRSLFNSSQSKMYIQRLINP